MNLSFLLCFILFSSCSSTRLISSDLPSIEKFNYFDPSGTYLLTKEIKRENTKLISRTQLTSMVKGKKNLVEKSVTLSQLGSLQGKKTRVMTLKPLASEFSVWLEGQKYTSVGETSEKEKAYNLRMDSPEIKWKGQKKILFPQGKFFCFYSQLWECLYSLQRFQVLSDLPESSFEFYLIWDNYPYLQDQLTDVGYEMFTKATLKYEETINNELKYAVEVDGQLINFFLNTQFRMKKMVWVAQGITILALDVKLDQD